MADAPVQPTHATTAPPEGGSGGLPQFDLAQWPGQMVWLLLIFAVLYVLFAKVFVPRVGETIARREDTIGGDLHEARRLKEQADAQVAEAAAETALARAAAQRLASDAKAKGRAEAAAREAKEEAKLAETLARAEANIRDARDKAMGHVREIAEDTAKVIVAKLVGGEAEAPKKARAPRPAATPTPEGA